MPRKFLSCFNILVRGNIEMGFILLGIKALDPSGGIRLRCFIEGLTQLGFVLRNLFMFSLCQEIEKGSHSFPVVL